MTYGWFEDLEVTNDITIGGTALAATYQPLHALLTSISGLSLTANDVIYATAATTFGKIDGVNNAVLGWNAAGTIGAYTSFSLDDSAAQFYSATASKGTLKNLLSGSTDGKLLTVSYLHTDNKTLYVPDPTTGDYFQLGSAPVRFNTGGATARVKTISDAADTIAEVGQTNTFTGTNAFNGVATTIGDATSGDKVKVNLDAIGIGDAEWNGTTITLACGEDITAPAPVYVKSDGKAWMANADAIATMPAIGLMVETCDVDASEVKKILIHGVYRKDASYAFTVGSFVYVDDSAAGVLTHTVGDVSGTDHVVQVFGVALDADYLLVNPSLSVITLE
jgi:hypothetical protein